MVVKSAAELRQLVEQILLAAGADEFNASGVAEHLVLANLSGVDTHGVWHVKGYLDAIAKGDIAPAARPLIVEEAATSALVRGNWTFGHVVARYGMEVAIEKARARAMAIAGLVQLHHIGRLGHYAEMAAAQGMIAMVWAGGFGVEEPVAVPYGGRERVLHTNPVAMAFPAGDEPPMGFDFATTALSGVKLINAQRRNQELPPGSIVDKEGEPSTHPDDFLQGGGCLPFGGHKGYALMLASEFLGRIFSGADAFADPQHGGATMRHQGVCMIVFKADLFQPFADYAGRADDMGQRVRAVQPAPGFEEVLVPGDLEVRSRAERERHGIPIHEDVWQSLVQAAGSVGVQVD